MRDRSFRISQEKKRKKKAKRILQTSLNHDRFDDPKEIGKTASVHGAGCSCHMCGNPRKYYNEKTLQEKKKDIEQKEI